MANSLEGRVAVIFGLANKRSIAWAIAQKLHAEGAQIAITYQNERLRLEAEDIIASLPGAQGFQCDVTKDEEISEVFRQIGERHAPDLLACFQLVELLHQPSRIAFRPRLLHEAGEFRQGCCP